jgi:hypothetical protein
MDKVKLILIYCLFFILPWKAALPNLLGDLIASSIDKIIVIILLLATFKYWGYILFNKISTVIFFLITYLFIILFLMFLHIEHSNLVLQFSDYVIPFLMVFVGLVIFRERTQVDQFFKIIIIYSAIIAFLGTFELFNESYRQWANEIAVREIESTSLDDIYNRFRARFFFSSVMGFGVYCGVFLMICIYYRERMEGQKKMIYSMCSLILFIGLLASYSRGPWVMFSTSLLCYYLIKVFRNEIIFNRIIKASIYFIPFLIYLLYSGEGVLLELITDRIYSISNWSTDNSNTTRIDRWQESLKYFYRYPITGLGLSSTGTSGLYTGQMIITENYYLKLAIEGGFILICYFVLLQIFIIIHLFKNILKKKENSLYLSIFIGFIIYMFIYQILEDRIIAYLYWFLVGISFSTLKKSNDNLAN